MSLIFSWGTFIAACILTVKGYRDYAIGLYIVTALCWISFNVSRVALKLDKIVKAEEEKRLADKTLTALMMQAKKGEK